MRTGILLLVPLLECGGSGSVVWVGDGDATPPVMVPVEQPPTTSTPPDVTQAQDVDAAVRPDANSAEEPEAATVASADVASPSPTPVPEAAPRPDAAASTLSGGNACPLDPNGGLVTCHMYTTVAGFYVSDPKACKCVLPDGGALSCDAPGVPGTFCPATVSYSCEQMRPACPSGWTCSGTNVKGTYVMSTCP